MKTYEIHAPRWKIMTGWYFKRKPFKKQLTKNNCKNQNFFVCETSITLFILFCHDLSQCRQ